MFGYNGLGVVYLDTGANFFRKHFDYRRPLTGSCGCQSASALPWPRVSTTILETTRNAINSL